MTALPTFEEALASSQRYTLPCPKCGSTQHALSVVGSREWVECSECSHIGPIAFGWMCRNGGALQLWNDAAERAEASPVPPPNASADDHFRKRLHDIVFRHLPHATSKEAQASHRLADAIAADLVGEMASP